MLPRTGWPGIEQIPDDIVKLWLWYAQKKILLNYLLQPLKLAWIPNVVNRANFSSYNLKWTRFHPCRANFYLAILALLPAVCQTKLLQIHITLNQRAGLHMHTTCTTCTLLARLAQAFTRIPGAQSTKSVFHSQFWNKKIYWKCNLHVHYNLNIHFTDLVS